MPTTKSVATKQAKKFLKKYPDLDVKIVFDRKLKKSDVLRYNYQFFKKKGKTNKIL